MKEEKMQVNSDIAIVLHEYNDDVITDLKFHELKIVLLNLK